jgi:NAD(P)-dependent dehydrogenase (short-subunit alcohol dehydrogenase family)
MAKSPSKRVVLTGVSRGLGLAMAEGFIALGHTVCGCARSAAAVEELGRRFGPPHAFEALDVSDDAAVAGWASRVLAAAEPPDLLVNNAALINRNAPLWQVPPEEFDRLLAVNVAGTVNVIRHFLPAMIRRGRGVVVNFSSGWGRCGAAEVAPYCATKWAIEGLSQAMAEEVPRGLAVVALNPGIIDTAMLRSCWGSDAGSYPDPAAWARRAVPYLLSLGPADNGVPREVPGG